MNPFATHISILLACLEHTQGPVLELGSGLFSTPVIAAFAVDRFVRTIESDPNWHARVCQFCNVQPVTKHRHQVVYVPDYEDAPIADHHWSVVLLDHEPPARRGIDAARLRDNCQLLIGHDSQHPDYGYGPVFDTFKFRFTDERMMPWTTVVSDEPLDWLGERIGRAA